MPKKINSPLQDVLKKPYARVLMPEEDGTYSAQMLEFPGCYAEGDTADEAIADLEKAAAAWIEAAREQHQEIPEPLANYEYSGKINLRLPKSIHKQAARFAQQDDVSLDQYFASAIAARVGAEEFYHYLAQRLEARFISVGTIANVQQNICMISFASNVPSGLFGSNIATDSLKWVAVPSMAIQETKDAPVLAITAR